MKFISKGFFNFLPLCILITFSLSSFAATYYSRTTYGNWNSNTSWSLTCGGASVGAGIFPLASDDIIICTGKSIVVNVNANCNNITIQGSGSLIFQVDNINLNAAGNLILDNANGLATNWQSNIGGSNNSSRICNVAGSFTVNSNCTTAAIGGVVLNVAGATSVNGFLFFNSGGGNKTFTGDVTISPSGKWDATYISNGNFILNGSFTNNGVFASGQGNPYILAGTNKIIGGTNPVTFNNKLTVNGSYINTNIITLVPAGFADLLGTGSLTQGPNSVLNIGHNSDGLAILNAGSNPNTVNYTYYSYGANIKGTAYYDLNFGSGGCFFLKGPLQVNHDLSIANNALINGNGFTNSVAGTTILNGTGAINMSTAADVFNLQNVIMNGGSLGVNGGATGTINIAGTFTVPASFTATLCMGNQNFIGPSIINGNIVTNGGFASGTKTFKGLMTVGPTGSWVNSGAVGSPVFQGGITVNGGGTFTNAPTVIFNTNNQTLSGTLKFIQGSTINGITVTNNGTANFIQLYSTSVLLQGTGSWIQGPNSILNYGGFDIAPAPFVFNATASGNTVNYNATGNAQNIFRGVSNAYYHLTISGGNIKGFAGNTIINGDLLITGPCSVNVSGLFGTNGFGFAQNISGTTTVSGGASLSFNTWNASCSVNTTNLTLNSGTINRAGSNNGNNTLTVANNFSVASGTNKIEQIHFSVGNASSISGTGTVFNLPTNIANTATFSGNISVANGSTFSVQGYTASTGNGIFTLKGGLTGDGTFNGTRAFFTTNNQTITGNGGSINFSDVVSVAAAKTVTNNHPNVNITNTGAGMLQGAGSWAQGTGTLHYAGSTITVANFSASNSGNTVDFNAAIAQNIFNPQNSIYFNLTLSNSAKTLSASLKVNGDLLLKGNAVLNSSPVNHYSVSIKGNLQEEGGTEVNIEGQDLILDPNQ